MTQSRIDELERVRKETGLWRSGAFGVVLAAVVASVALLFSDAKGLVAQGPTQDKFVASLQKGLNEHIVPRLKDVAGNTLSTMQPIVQTEFKHLNERVPEVTEASLKQLDELEKSLPERTGKVVQETLGAAITEKEADIRAAFPDLTEESMHALVENLKSMAVARSTRIGQDLLAPHMAAMKRIQTNLGKIAATEKSVKGENIEDWQLGLAVFDVLRSDIDDAKKPSKPAKKFAKNETKEEKA